MLVFEVSAQVDAVVEPVIQAAAEGDEVVGDSCRCRSRNRRELSL